jgi:hypothetical protein
MICALCSRPMREAAAFVAGQPIGPVCARKNGWLQPKGRAVRVMHSKTPAAAAGAVVRDDKTIDLFGVEQ